jgi:hypothetical protein
MANTYIVTNNKFKPYTFEEMLKPYQMYTEAYNKADTELNTLLEDAATKGFNFSPQDTAEAEAYNAILGRIQTASEQLATGLNPALSKEIQQLNKDYRKVMLPIQQQLNKRAELAAEQRELLSKNPNLRFTKDYSAASLKDITSSSTYNVIDLDNLYKTTAQEFGSKTSTLYRDDIEPTPIGNTGYYNVTTGYGYTPEDFKDAFYGDNGRPKTNSDIYKFYKEKVDAIEARKDISDDVKIEMANAVFRGMEASAGTFKTSQVKGRFADAPTSKMIKIGENLYELSGALYQYDKDGNLYKVGNKPTSSNQNDSPSSSDGSKNEIASQRKPRLEKRMFIKFADDNTVKEAIYDPIETASGIPYSYNAIKLAYPHMATEIDTAISGDDNINYTYFVKGKNLHIVPKDIEIVDTKTENLRGVGI